MDDDEGDIEGAYITDDESIDDVNSNYISEDGETFGGSLEAENVISSFTTGPPYRTITSDVLGNLQQEAVQRAVSTLACSSSQATIALRHFRWDYERLLEAVAETDKEAVFSRVGAATSGFAEVAPGSASTCMICFGDISDNNPALTMECGHVACQNCWLEHMRVKISEGMACGIPCMAYKCGAVCAQPLVTSLLAARESDLLKKYERAMLNSYIEDNANARWCPSVPCCGRAVEALDDGYCELVCDCGHAFCFKCGGSPHSPSTCQMWKQWQTKLSDDSETINYLKAHSKPCPRCGVLVEKDGGCNLVVCRSCRQPFCWLCGAKTGMAHTWTQIDGHKCGEWKQDKDKIIEDSKAKHQRYMHYYGHYQGHLASLEKETMGKTLADLLPKLKDHVSGLVDWTYLQHANCVLLECRRVLSNAYVFAFFMFNGETFLESMTSQENERLQRLFEDSMSSMTSSVEQLSRFLEDDVRALKGSLPVEVDETSRCSPITLVGKARETPNDAGTDSSRLRIINITVSIEKRINNLFNLIEKDILSAVHSENVQISPYNPVYVVPS